MKISRLSQTVVLACAVLFSSTKVMACGMSLFGSPIFLLFMPFMIVEEAGQNLARGVHQAKANVRKLPENIKLRHELDSYFKCVENNHADCPSCGRHTHLNHTEPTFLKQNRDQDAQVWAELLQDVLHDYLDRFAALNDDELAKISDAFKARLERVNLAREIAQSNTNAFEEFFAHYEPRFWTPGENEKEDFKKFAQHSFAKVYKI
jgi:hypothetical protein